MNSAVVAPAALVRMERAESFAERHQKYRELRHRALRGLDPHPQRSIPRERRILVLVSVLGGGALVLAQGFLLFLLGISLGWILGGTLLSVVALGVLTGLTVGLNELLVQFLCLLTIVRIAGVHPRKWPTWTLQERELAKIARCWLRLHTRGDPTTREVALALGDELAGNLHELLELGRALHTLPR